MDNQTIGPSNQPAPLQPQAPNPYQLAPSSPAPKRSGGRVILVILLVILGLTAGALGYLYYKSSNDLKKKSQELSSTYQTVESFQAIIDKEEAAKAFVAKENNAELSRALCGGAPVAMFDVHLNDQFGVFRYLCANQSHQIRIGALKKLDNGSYEFTYGSSESKSNQLPDYIFNTEPEFFGGPYGAVMF